MDKGFEIKDMLVGNETPDEIMDLITDTFEKTLVPEVGGYYTFIYSPTTPNIQYDQYPLVAVTELFSWGFRGINYHWGEYRNYGWGEVGANSFHQISTMEIKSVRSLPYAKYLLNN
tara:strand:+ start:364 stop:711 length:348 start_codon:yes stop_codon:yes gene_type:complete